MDPAQKRCLECLVGLARCFLLCHSQLDPEEVDRRPSDDLILEMTIFDLQIWLRLMKLKKLISLMPNVWYFVC